MASLRRSGEHAEVSRGGHTREYETTLGVGVINFNRLSIHCVYARETIKPHCLTKHFRTYMSPGLVALGPGKFSVSGVATMRLIGSCSWAIAKAEATTVAAPPVWKVNEKTGWVQRALHTHVSAHQLHPLGQIRWLNGIGDWRIGYTQLLQA